MTRDLLEDRRTLLVVAALIAVLFGIANLPWQLDDYDQAKQAFTSSRNGQGNVHGLWARPAGEWPQKPPPLIS